jgi:hypothetical protein
MKDINKIVLEKENDHSNTKCGLIRGEYDPKETKEQFIERVKNYMIDFFITRGN